ncbi:protein of unknown function UPF0054 [Chloroherpeton thalassium ATCC 35110]|uniref:Endoribonuclease YbeY n=1 Tax=Chloroherpeton thalassium (strain ATCC 35110 / GB-78) TaxID=517418 RepID=YBEY_CHLT3|nr:rRNA maturation RNase YbeY [Chloroherpeton thalassium]B3QTP2.1 RecName: Full=Endoribonuclease YbeY [Chloroherpeton thalassium ATCC 35110]ACF14240.1 protein of unknown function UPF0054 [Chloroherpeton thalassium ATCC 35110]
MSIIISKTVKQELPEEKIRKAIELVLQGEKCEAEEISAVYCGDRLIRKINIEHLAHDYPTDTISFRLNSGNAIEGEFYISCDTVRRNAQEYESSFENELLRVTIHSVLHLIGFEDQSAAQKAEMTQKENRYLAALFHHDEK